MQKLDINIESVLDKHYKFGIDLVNKHFSKQLEIFKEDLTTIALNSISKGVPQDYILEYLSFYYEDVHEKLFPNQPMLL